MGFVNLDLEILNQHIEQEIEYYELWDPVAGDFKRGRSFIHGMFSDYSGQTKIYSSTIWGEGLENAVFTEDGFKFDNDQFIYLAPAPFSIFQISFLNEYGITEQRLIPGDSPTDLDIIAREIAKGYYEALKVNLDGSPFKIFKNEKY